MMYNNNNPYDPLDPYALYKRAEEHHVPGGCPPFPPIEPDEIWQAEAFQETASEFRFEAEAGQPVDCDIPPAPGVPSNADTPVNPQANEQHPYLNNYMMSHPQYNAAQQSYPSFSLRPAYEAAAIPPSKKRARAFFPVLALCLCFTLIGSALGGYLVLNLYEPPAVVSDMPVNTLSPDTAPGASSGSNAADSGAQDAVKPIIYQPGAEMTPAQIFEQCNPGVVAISTETAVRNVFGQTVTQPAAGSGFIISEDGYIITNNHVIDGASSIKALLSTGDTYDARLIGRDAANDLAVLKIDAAGLTALSWGASSSLSVGDPVVAIGNPLGELANSATAGIVSALDRSIDMDGTPMTYLQIDASVSPGNSGGPLFDQYGRVVGVVSAKSSGSGVEGIGFAIPSEIAHVIIDQLIQYGYVTGRPQLGITIQAVDETMSRYYNLPVGVYVVSVEPGSCAETAGLQTGDVIIEFGGVKVSTQADLVGQKNTRKAGETVAVKVVRAGNEMTLNVTLDEAQADANTPAQPDDQMMPPWMQRQQDTEM